MLYAAEQRILQSKPHFYILAPSISSMSKKLRNEIVVKMHSHLDAPASTSPQLIRIHFLFRLRLSRLTFLIRTYFIFEKPIFKGFFFWIIPCVCKKCLIFSIILRNSSNLLIIVSSCQRSQSIRVQFPTFWKETRTIFLCKFSIKGIDCNYKSPSIGFKLY